jgi:succinate-semialdehyde dehydrogenase/glutarate-semialdehyde dehydrogenase
VVKDIETAIEKANNTMFGLSNAIFSTNLKKAQNIAARLESGMVFINDPFIAMPGWDHWTGWKNSGFGTTESKIMQCLKKKIISMNKKGQCRSFWYPYPNP